MMPAPGVADTPPVPTVPADVLELRRDLVRRAGVLRARARSLRARGSLHAAVRVDEGASKLLALSRRMA